MQSGISSDNIIVWSTSWADAFGVYVAMIVKAVVCCIHSMFFKKKNTDIIFSSSFFLPDLIPALMLKLYFPTSKLVTAAYLFTTKKWGSDYSGGRIKGFLFYINQVIFLFITKKYNGAVLTASEYDRKRLAQFYGMNEQSVLAVRGGVDNAFFASIPAQDFHYDAVFVGRFHPQKCVAELIYIWSKVVKQYPKRILALVGGGILEDELKNLVLKNGLQKNVLFMGVQDGIPKTKILKASRIFLSASRYDSGNIALDEALACGVPGIVYDLPRLNYPNGVTKVPIGNQDLFIDSALDLLNQEEKHKKLSDEALSFAQTIDWNNTAEKILRFINPVVLANTF
jgi:glycosyltransferase involved in cell wall biosynthesis